MIALLVWMRAQDPTTDPDYAIQGLYQGGGYSVQVVALGGGRFDAWLVHDSKKLRASGKREGAQAVLTGEWTGTIKDGRLEIEYATNVVGLLRVIPKSPTEGLLPPPGAVVLASRDEWPQGSFRTELLLPPAKTRRSFGDMTLHAEFRTSFEARSAGALVVGGRHEIKLLDAFGRDPADSGSIAGIKASTSPCFAPLVWQTLDMEYSPEPGSASVTLNGVKIHDNARLGAPGEPAPIRLEGPGLAFRNAWAVEWTGLFNGRDLSGWIPTNGGEYEARDRVIAVTGRKGFGWLRTEKTYRDFELVLEWKTNDPKYDSGVFIRAAAKGSPWPRPGYQIQIARGDDGHGYGNIENAPATPQLTKFGEWNRYEVSCRGDVLALRINGQDAWTTKDPRPREGHVGLQAEGHEVLFRNIRIREF